VAHAIKWTLLAVVRGCLRCCWCGADAQLLLRQAADLSGTVAGCGHVQVPLPGVECGRCLLRICSCDEVMVHCCPGPPAHLDAHGLEVVLVLHVADAPGRREQSLGWHAPAVDAGSTDVVPLNHCNLQPLHPDTPHAFDGSSARAL
jgi:hypothetical protein